MLSLILSSSRVTPNCTLVELKYCDAKEKRYKVDNSKLYLSGIEMKLETWMLHSRALQIVP